MDEFGQMPEVAERSESPTAEDHAKALQKPTPITSNARPSSSRRRESPPPSPAPFAHYTRYTLDPKSEDEPPVTTQRVVQEEVDAGCCRCVIM